MNDLLRMMPALVALLAVVGVLWRSVAPAFAGLPGGTAVLPEAPNAGVPDIDVPAAPLSPRLLGSFDSVTVLPGAGGIEFRGWALNSRRAGPVRVRISVRVPVGSQWYWARTEVLADQARPDVARAFPGSGDGHGFTSVWPLDAATVGEHLATVDAVDPVTGGITSLGCRTFVGV